jgi:hypothetical protein
VRSKELATTMRGGCCTGRDCSTAHTSSPSYLVQRVRNCFRPFQRAQQWPATPVTALGATCAQLLAAVSEPRQWPATPVRLPLRSSFTHAEIACATMLSQSPFVAILNKRPGDAVCRRKCVDDL